MKTESVLVELFVCEDSLCGGETFELIEVEDQRGFSYIERQPKGEKSELLLSSKKLTDEQVITLLDEKKWFNADIPLGLADISGVEEVPRLFEGKFPLFTISGAIDEASLRFREWAEEWIKRHRASVD